MVKRREQRIEKAFRDLLFKDRLKPLIEDLRKRFEALKEKPSYFDFNEWLNVRQYRWKIKNSSEKEFLASLDTLREELSGEWLYYRGIGLFINYILFNEAPREKEYIGVSHEDCFKHDNCHDILIEIRPEATEEDVVGYIKKNWKSFRKELNQGAFYSRPFRKKLKIRQNVERDELVYQFSQKTIEELQEMAGDSTSYKDIAISMIMEKRGHKMTPENIRRIISRQKNLRK